MRRIFFTVAAAAPLILNAQSFADAPPLWTELDFTEAREKAAAEDRVLLVYATASWCPPCRMMERSTWQSEAVHEWFAEHGVAYKLDVDHQRDLAQAHDVEFMPTMIAYRNNEPFDRIGGYKSDRELLDWLGNVREGRREVDRLIEAAGERVGPDGKVDIRARLDLARALVRGGALDEATEEYLWLWDNMLDHDYGFVGVRISFMISDMERLAQRHGPAKEAFSQRRAEYWPRIEDGTATGHEVDDWSHLARVVGEEESVLAWFDIVKDNPDARDMIRHTAWVVTPILIERGRWADIAVFYPDDPVEQIRSEIAVHMRFQEMELDERDPMRVHTQSVEQRRKRNRISQMYAVLLAARRDDEANQIADLLLKIDNSTQARGALVKAALEAGEVRRRQLQWIDEAEEMGARVPRARRQVTEALVRQTG